MKTYEAKFNPDTNEGIFAISLVKDPAMEGFFVALKKQELRFSTVDKDEQILIGLVLEPDKKVFRSDEKHGDFDVVFRADTIKDLAHNFLIKGYQHNSKLEHEKPIEDISVTESWIVADPENDKSNAFGLEMKKGSWVAMMKINNKDIWNNYVKTGEVKGFSVDGFVDLQEVNFSSQEQKREKKNLVKDITDAIALGFQKITKPNVKFGSVISGEVTIEFEGNQIEQGEAVWVTANDERVPLPIGNYPLEGNKTLVVEQEGVVASIGEAKNEDDDAQELQGEGVEAIKEAISGVLTKFTKNIGEVIEEQNKKLAAMELKNKELSEQLLEYSKKPGAKPITKSGNAGTGNKVKRGAGSLVEFLNQNLDGKRN